MDVFLKVLTAKNLESRKRGREFLKLLMQTNPDLLPEFYNYYEPINIPYDIQHVDEVLNAWQQSILFRRRGKPRLLGMVFVGRGPRVGHHSISLDVAAGYFRQPEKVAATLNLMRELCNWCQPNFAYLHFLQPQEVELGRLTRTTSPSGRTGKRWRLSIGREIFSYLPDLYWLTIFGPPYVKLFGRERLLSAPAYRVEELPYGMVWIQLSESPLDMRDRYDELHAQRQAIKAHLNQNAFFDPGFHPRERDFVGRTPEELEAKIAAWYGTHTYNVPEFDLSELRAPLPTPEEAAALRQSIKEQFGVLTFTRPETLADGRVVRLVGFRFWPPSTEDIEEGWRRLRRMALRDLRRYRGQHVEYVFHRLPAELVGRLEELQRERPDFRYAVQGNDTSSGSESRRS